MRNLLFVFFRSELEWKYDNGVGKRHLSFQALFHMYFYFYCLKKKSIFLIFNLKKIDKNMVLVLIVKHCELEPFKHNRNIITAIYKKKKHFGFSRVRRKTL